MAAVKLTDIMKKRQLLSFELFPPKTEKGMSNLSGTIEHLREFHPDYISVTYGAGGGNVGANREVCRMIQKAEMVPVTHFTVIRNTKEGIKEQLNRYHNNPDIPAPEFWLNPEIKDFYEFDHSKECKDCKLIDYKHMGKIKFPLAQ